MRFYFVVIGIYALTNASTNFKLRQTSPSLVAAAAAIATAAATAAAAACYLHPAAAEEALAQLQQDKNH